MNTLKRLFAVLFLISAISFSAFGNETAAPPCAPPEPGITETPPCSTPQTTSEESPTPSETEGLPAANAVDVLSVAETAMNLLLVF